jgi:hypothetical protein
MHRHLTQTSAECETVSDGAVLCGCPQREGTATVFDELTLGEILEFMAKASKPTAKGPKQTKDEEWAALIDEAEVVVHAAVEAVSDYLTRPSRLAALLRETVKLARSASVGGPEWASLVDRIEDELAKE